LLKNRLKVTNVIVLHKKPLIFVVSIDLMDFIRRNIKFVFILLLPVYFYIVENTILNKHTHVYSNGLIITHSHPLNNDTDDRADHDHTKSEINLICGLNIDFHLAPELFHIDAAVCALIEIRKSESEKIPCKLIDFHLIPRGPPAVQIS
jgi:hypothetical protein